MTDRIIPFRRGNRHERSDELLVGACATGDNSALDELFRRHGGRVRRIFVRLRCIARSDLDDVVQTTFLEVKRSAGRFGERATVEAWILGIAMNVMRHYVRGESRRRSAMSAVAQISLSIDERKPDEHAVHRQTLARIQVAFDALPPDLRIAFTLCDLEGMKGTDVAKALEVPEGTVWRRLHQARMRLRSCIAEEVKR